MDFSRRPIREEVASVLAICSMIVVRIVSWDASSTLVPQRRKPFHSFTRVFYFSFPKFQFESSMADEAPTSETPPQIAEQTPASVEATIESNSQGGTHSSCNNNDKTCAPTSDGDRAKSLEYADELMERGSTAAKDCDYPEVAECYSRALEIRVGPECVNAYYKYGCVLLYKAQEEADPLGIVPRKEGESKQASDKDGSVKNAINGESSAASVSSNVVKDGSSILKMEHVMMFPVGKLRKEMTRKVMLRTWLKQMRTSLIWIWHGKCWMLQGQLLKNTPTTRWRKWTYCQLWQKHQKWLDQLLLLWFYQVAKSLHPIVVTRGQFFVEELKQSP